MAGARARAGHMELFAGEGREARQKVPGSSRPGLCDADLRLRAHGGSPRSVGGGVVRRGRWAGAGSTRGFRRRRPFRAGCACLYVCVCGTRELCCAWAAAGALRRTGGGARFGRPRKGDGGASSERERRQIWAAAATGGTSPVSYGWRAGCLAVCCAARTATRFSTGRRVSPREKVRLSGIERRGRQQRGRKSRQSK